jgi:hypothetical protein
MPVRFQVDADFYDHPKTIGLSDAAVALWTRAGSYCAAKLTDGLVPDAKLSDLSSSPSEAAEELVKRGLWRRAKGGYRFHQWDHRNLTKKRVESDRKADRERKRVGRGNGRGISNSGRSDTVLYNRNPTGIQPESERIPEDSVSVSVSVSSKEDSYVRSSPSVPRELPDGNDVRSKPVNVQAAIVSREYTGRVKLADRAKVAGVVQQAIDGGYDVAVIRAALRRLAKDSRPVTPDTLRIEIDGKGVAPGREPKPAYTPPRNGMRGREGW